MIKRAERMTQVVSALQARTQFGQIMKRASTNKERFLVDRRGEPSVIIMSVKDYVDTIAPAPRWLERAWAKSKRTGADALTIGQINREIRAVRRELRDGKKKDQARPRTRTRR